MNTRDSNPPNINIRHELKPGDAGRLVELHGLLYAQEYGFDPTFEAYVAKPLADFILSRTDRDEIWLVNAGEVHMGSIAIVGQSESDAQLRWFLLHPDVRGRGLGTKLVNEAVAFCRARKYRNVFLWTVSLLEAAAHVYRRAGFHLTQETTHAIWGRVLTEQRYDMDL